MDIWAKAKAKAADLNGMGDIAEPIGALAGEAVGGNATNMAHSSLLNAAIVTKSLNMQAARISHRSPSNFHLTVHILEWWFRGVAGNSSAAMLLTMGVTGNRIAK